MILTSCGDVVTTHYSTLNEAKADRLFARGWLPDVLPPSATNIEVSNDLDLNHSWGRFEFMPKEYETLQASLSKYGAPDPLPPSFPERLKRHLQNGYPAIAAQDRGSVWLFLCRPELGDCEYIMADRRDQ